MAPRPVRAGGVGLALLLGLAAVLPPVVFAQVSCSDVAIRSPFALDTVRGVVPVMGSARIEGFGFYKVEWAAAHDPEGWKAVSATYGTPVKHGQLDAWDTARLPDGTYRLRLVVVDQSGQEPCRQVVGGLRVANDSAADDPAAEVVTPTVTIRAARHGELPPADSGPNEVATTVTAGRESGSGQAAGAVPDSEASPTSALAEAASRDFPLEIQRGSPDTGAETPTSAEHRALDMLDPSTWLTAVGVSTWPMAFAGGAMAALLLALFGLVVVGLRRSR